MKKYKKILATLLSASMIMGLVACGSKPADNQNEASSSSQKESSSQSTSSSADNAATSSSEAAKEPVTLRVASWRTSDEAIYAEIAKRFNEQYDWITVEFDLNPDEASYTTNLQVDLAEEEGPDLFDMHTGTAYVTYAQEELLLNLDDMEFLNRYQEGPKAITEVDGSQYGWLNDYNMLSILYNKKVFADNNLSEPKTFDEFVTLVNTLKDLGYGGLSYPGGAVSYAWLMNSLLTINCGSVGYKDFIEGMDSGRYTNIEEVAGVSDALKTAQAYRDNKILYNGWEATDVPQSISLFATEKAAMLFMGTWTFGTRDTDFPGLDVGVFAIPTLSNNGKHYAEGGQVTCINAASENIEAAKLYLDFISSPEITGYYCSETKMISTIDGVGLDFEGGDVLSAASANGVNLLPTYTRNNKDYWSGSWKEIQTELVVGTKDYTDVVTAYNANLVELNLKSISQ